MDARRSQFRRTPRFPRFPESQCPGRRCPALLQTLTGHGRIQMAHAAGVQLHHPGAGVALTVCSSESSQFASCTPHAIFSRQFLEWFSISVVVLRLRGLDIRFKRKTPACLWLARRSAASPVVAVYALLISITWKAIRITSILYSQKTLFSFFNIVPFCACSRVKQQLLLNHTINCCMMAERGIAVGVGKVPLSHFWFYMKIPQLFPKASRRLFITQQGLSRQIQA